MLKILRGGKVVTPSGLENADILIAGGMIDKVSPNISLSGNFNGIEEYDVSDKYIIPGFIDQHVHLIGGGGEKGFSSRTPEIRLSSILKSGITTVVGCLGTDGTTRHMTSLLAKARALEEEGITTYIYTGAYQVPTVTITGSVRDDIVLIDKIIGCGEIAISDHRSSQPSREDIKKLAAECRVGGMISGKAGVLHLHVGDGKDGLKYITEIVDESEIPISQFKPTHVNRNKKLLDEGVNLAIMGGMIDITSSIFPDKNDLSAIKSSKAIKYCLDKGVNAKDITMSSDGNGSMPVFDKDGNIIGFGVADTKSLYDEFVDMVFEEHIDIETAIKFISENPAKSLSLYPRKGAIQEGSDADIIVLNKDLTIEHLFAKGRCMIEKGNVIVKGMFE